MDAFKSTTYLCCNWLRLILEMFELPLTEKVSFKTRLERANRLQISKCIRMRYKLEPKQYLKVTVDFSGVWGSPQTFQTRIRKDGKIAVPKLNLELVNCRKIELNGNVVNVTLEPF
jgi:hypothetical protein